VLPGTTPDRIELIQAAGSWKCQMTSHGRRPAARAADTEARLAEIRRLLDDEKLRGRGVPVERVSTVTAYRQESAGYIARGYFRAG
jgi:hypothetical protein